MIDLLVLTALQEELTPLLALHPLGAAGWRKDVTSEGFIYYAASLPLGGHEALDVVALAQHEPGPTAAAFHTANLLRFRPRLAAMVGICAGRRRKGIALGDVIIAHTTFRYDAGKQTASGIEPEIHARAVHPTLQQWLQDFEARGPSMSDLGQPPPPRSLRYQREWILFSLAKQEGSAAWPRPEHFDEARSNCPRWSVALEQVRRLGFVTLEHPLQLTAEGRDTVALLRANTLLDEPVLDPPQSRVWTGALATGPLVVGDDKFFTTIAQRERRVLALDMEGAAFLDAAASRPDLPAVVIKGVADFGDELKDDLFHEYASGGAVRVLWGLLQVVMPMLRDSQHSVARAIAKELEKLDATTRELFRDLIAGNDCSASGEPQAGRLKLAAEGLQRLNLATIDQDGDSVVVRRTAIADALRSVLDFSLMSERSSVRGVGSRTYPIVLPRPAKTQLDRKLWYAFLQWSAEEELWFEERLGGSSAGIEFYQISEDEYLAEVQVGMGAYQGTYIYYYLNEGGGRPVASRLAFRMLWSPTESYDDIRECMASSLVGLPDVSADGRSLSVFYKGRGLGDYGAVYEYSIRGPKTELVACRLGFHKDSPLERAGADEEGADPELPVWPEVDVERTYSVEPEP